MIITNSFKDDNHQLSQFSLKYPIAPSTRLLSYAFPHSYSSTKAHQNYYYDEYYEGVLEIANSLFKILLNQMVDNTMVAAVKEK